MIKKYENGNDFIEDNKEFLNQKPDETAFYFLDAPLLKEHSKINYSFKIEEDGKKIIGIKVIPFDLLIYGNKELVGNVIDFILNEEYEMNNVLCEETLGLAFIKSMKEKKNIDYDEVLAMDFMKCVKSNYESCELVQKPTIEDIDRIYEGLLNFVRDCNLEDVVHKEKLQKNLDYYRVIKEDGKVVSFAICLADNEKQDRISNVYTFDEYRGKGYCKKIVSTITNEIIANGKIAALNVDQRNPITNHIYSSIGYRRVFSQGEFRRMK